MYAVGVDGWRSVGSVVVGNCWDSLRMGVIHIYDYDYVSSSQVYIIIRQKHQAACNWFQLTEYLKFQHSGVGSGRSGGICFRR